MKYFALGYLMAVLFLVSSQGHAQNIDYSALQGVVNQWNQDNQRQQPSTTYMDPEWRNRNQLRQTRCVTQLVFGNYVTTCE